MVGYERFRGTNLDALWSMITSEFILFFSSTTRLVKIFRTSSTTLEVIFRNWPSKKFKEGLCFLDRKANGIETKAAWLSPKASRKAYNLGTCFLLLARAACDVMTSLLWEVCQPVDMTRLSDSANISQVMWLFFSLAWGTLRIFSTRQLADNDSAATSNPQNSVILQEDFWGFGQWTPTLFLILPCLSFAEAWLGKSFISRHIEPL